MLKLEIRGYYGDLGAYLQKLREARGLTQAAVAREIGITQQALFAYEHGERRVSVIVLDKLAKLYGVKLDPLVRRNEKALKHTDRVSARILRYAERMMVLEKTQQRIVIQIIESLEDRNAGLVPRKKLAA